MSSKDKINIVLITQEDMFAIPRNIKLLIDSEYINIQKCYLIDSPSSLINKKSYFINGFGLKQSIKMGLQVFIYQFLDLLNRVFSLPIPEKFISIRNICKSFNISLETIKDINSNNLLLELENLNTDLVVSYSAPTVFKKDLLELPKYGCINLHCSLLPKYSGVMPSFWTLLHNEKLAGCSIHTMDDLIDNGDLLMQKSLPINREDTMFTIIRKSKKMGGELMLETILYLNRFKKLPDKIQIDEADRTYYTWPKQDDFKKFKENKRKLI